MDLSEARPPSAARSSRRTALVVEIAEAEPTVGRHRAALDDNATRGVPPHVTVLFPFVEPGALDQSFLELLRRLLADRPAFAYRFSRTAWFGAGVLWLAPDDPRPFQSLTRAVWERFPAYPPYEGAHAEIVPHCTVGHRRPLAELQAADVELRRHLPVEGQATRVTLLIEDDAGYWSKAARFPLGRPR